MESYCRGDCNKNTNRREKEKKDKRKSQIKQKAANTSNVENTHYAQYFCFAAVSSVKRKCNQVGKGVAVYNLPPLNVMTNDDVTSPDLKSALLQPFSLQPL